MNEFRAKSYPIASTSQECFKMMKQHLSFKIYGKLAKIIFYDSLEPEWSTTNKYHKKGQKMEIIMRSTTVTAITAVIGLIAYYARGLIKQFGVNEHKKHVDKYISKIADMLNNHEYKLIVHRKPKFTILFKYVGK